MKMADESGGQAEFTGIIRSSGQALDAVAVEVSVEIGTFCLSLDELLDLSRGQAFEFRFDAGEPVPLRVGDQLIATARFVQDEGELYLQIDEVIGGGS